MRCLNKISSAIIDALEDGFEWWGQFVARNPIKVIVGCFALAILCGLGISQYREETRPDKLFFPQNSVYLEDRKWLKDHFPRTVRPQIHLWERPAGNVLTKDTILTILKAHQTIIKARSGNLTWDSQCYRIPIANLFITKRRKKRQTSNSSVDSLQPGWGEYDLTDYESFYEEPENAFEDVFTKEDDDDDDDIEDIVNDLPPEILCDLINTLNEKCLESSILEIWKFEEERISALTDQDIVNAVNRYRESPAYGFKFNYTDLLGTIKYNSSGHVIGAEAIRNFFFVERDPDLPLEPPNGGAELEHADALTLAWEAAYLNESHKLQVKAKEAGINLYVLGGRSFNDITQESIQFDIDKLLAGYVLMFIYTTFMLGRINLVEIRFFLTIAGFFSIIMGVIISVGLMLAFGYPFTNMMRIVPFLCLGVGIDDMFVIVQSWYNLHKHDDTDIAEKIGKTMRYAGVAITVTSVTDVCAFAIGMVTIIPALQSFCLTCAIGIATIFFFQLSWFMAWLALDQRRIAAHRNGIIPCYRHKDWQPSKFSEMELGSKLVKKIAIIATSTIGRIVVFVLTIGIASGGIYGCITMPIELDLLKFLPPNSYLAKFSFANKIHFPINGVEAGVYIGPIPEPEKDIPRLDVLIQKINDLEHRNVAVTEHDDWWSEYKEYMRDVKGFPNWEDTITKEGNFSMHLSNFLFSPSGAKYKNNFQFDEDLECGDPVPEIMGTSFSITFKEFKGPTEHVPGRKSVDDLIKEANFTSKAFSFDKKYAEWELDTVIGFEMWRNLGLAMIAVFLVTLILLSNIQICLYVLLCVVMTLLNTIGYLSFTDVTIDNVSSIIVIISIGVCVDYAAHIGHGYAVSTGTRKERAIQSMTEIGPAVLNGGITTFLAIVFLIFALTHPFRTFFKVFSFVVLFGQFHGLAFLPALLSVIGPVSNNDADIETSGKNKDTTNAKNSYKMNGIENASYANEA